MIILRSWGGHLPGCMKLEAFYGRGSFNHLFGGNASFGLCGPDAKIAILFPSLIVSMH